MAGKPPAKFAAPLPIGKFLRMRLVTFRELFEEGMEHNGRWIDSHFRRAALYCSCGLWR